MPMTHGVVKAWLLAVVLVLCQAHCDSSVVRLKSYPGKETGVLGTLRLSAVPGTRDLIHVHGFVTGIEVTAGTDGTDGNAGGWHVHTGFTCRAWRAGSSQTAP